MGEMQAAEELVMQGMRMEAGARQPTLHGHVGQVKDAGGGLEAEAFGDGMQDLGDCGGQGIETVECGVPARCEFMMAGLTIEVLDRITATVVPVADQGMNLRIMVIEVPTIGVGAGIARGIDRLLAPSRALEPCLGDYSLVRSGCGRGRGRSTLRTVVGRAGSQWARAGPGGLPRRGRLVNAGQSDQPEHE